MIKTILKILFSVAIVYWLVSKGHLDFSLTLKSLQHTTNWIIAISLVFFNLVFTSYRWKLLLEINSDKKFSLKKITSLTWIGLFFSAFLPGAVTGDLVKLVYARDLDKNLTKTYLITSALMDRIVGMFGLFIIMGATSLLYYNELVSLSPKMKPLLMTNFLICLGMICFYIFLLLPICIREFLVSYLIRIPKIGEKLVKMLLEFWRIGDNKKVTFGVTVMSVISQAGNMFAFWLITMPFYSNPIPFKYATTIIPLGLVSVAIPISPAGLGVGHAAFSGLFSLIGETDGASFFNIFFVVMVVFDLVGAIPYIFAHNKKLAH